MGRQRTNITRVLSLIVLMFLKTCGPLWAQQCGSQYYTTGVCSDVSPDFQHLASFSPAVQSKLRMCRGWEQCLALKEGKTFISGCHPTPQLYFKSHFHTGVKSDLPMEICFSYHPLCSLPFLHRCCGCM